MIKVTKRNALRLLAEKIDKASRCKTNLTLSKFWHKQQYMGVIKEDCPFCALYAVNCNLCPAHRECDGVGYLLYLLKYRTKHGAYSTALFIDDMRSRLKKLQNRLKKK